MSTSSTQQAWSEAATWTDGTIRREVFFFQSGGEHLYASFCGAVTPTRSVGLVLCSSWGIEAHRMGKLVGKLAHKVAELGGAALMFHYPGFGDSTGRSDATSVEDMAAAAIDAVAEARRREPGLTWGLAGVRLGACVAALAARRAGVSTLLLVQPALDPAMYFEDIQAMARRASLGRDSSDSYAFGYPIVSGIAPAQKDAVRAELGAFDGSAVAVSYDQPKTSDDALERFSHITVPGTWQFGLKSYPELKEGSLAALRRVLASDHG